MKNSIFLISFVLILGCGGSDPKPNNESNGNEPTDGSGLVGNQGEENPSLVEDGDLFINAIDHDGDSAELHFINAEADALANLINGDIFMAGHNMESASLGSDIFITCMNTNGRPGTSFCIMRFSDGHDNQYIREISFANRSIEVVINDANQGEDDENLRDFMKYFNADSSSDFEYESINKKFKLEYSTSANEMTITYKE